MATITQLKCTNCGAPLVGDFGIIECAHCGSLFVIESQDVKQVVIDDTKHDDYKGDSPSFWGVVNEPDYSNDYFFKGGVIQSVYEPDEEELSHMIDWRDAGISAADAINGFNELTWGCQDNNRAIHIVNFPEEQPKKRTFIDLVKEFLNW